MSKEGLDREAVAGLHRFDQDSILLERQYPELLKQYPNHWVAVYKGKVYIEPTHQDLDKTLRKHKVPLNRAAETFLSTIDKNRIVTRFA
ncbi:MAG: hypothetical protein HW403_133 [Dehalococcoidia bacterium]|nr:hypothetical protein [Dehalococcoidia bacterium]